MPKYQKYPIYQYDEPAIYDDFRGGINLDPSSQNLADNEMRDCVNMEYRHVTLHKRRGAKRLCRLIVEDNLSLIQGVFLFTKKESFILLAADGFLYYGLYVPDVDIQMQRLPIHNAKSPILYGEVMPSKTYNQFIDLPTSRIKRDNDYISDGYVLVSSSSENDELVFQNQDKVEFAAYNNMVFVATGTRIVVIEVDDTGTSLSANCVTPYVPSGEEYQIYGENFMSPYPYMYFASATGAVSAIKNIRFDLDKEYAANDESQQVERYKIKATAVMTLSIGMNTGDYFYQWEIRDWDAASKCYKWRTLFSYDDSYKKHLNENENQGLYTYNTITLCEQVNKDETSSTHNYGCDHVDYNTGEHIFYFNINPEDKANYIDPLQYIAVRCSFAEALTEDEEGNHTPDEISGAMFGQMTSAINSESYESTESTWRCIQTCKKILADGNKLLFYDDAYNSGSWFKTVIDNPGYVINRGCLNFKTNKNESLVKCVHFKGIIVAFSNSNLVGGNITIVSGNGDDDTKDEAYSPYIRKVAHPNIGCDDPNSVQVADNMLFFKYRDTIYAIEGSDISSEILTLYSMNDRLKMKYSSVKIPWSEACISEITNDYYGLCWKEDVKYEGNGLITTRPAMRLKMYYKIGQELDGKVVFPWLRDESPVFNIDGVIYINGVSTYLRDLELIQFDDEYYYDIDDSYDCSFKLKAYDLNYPKLSKFIKNTMIYYHRTSYGAIQINARLINEAEHSMFEAEAADISLQDLGSVYTENADGKIGTTLTDTKVFNPKYMFPLLQASFEMTVKCDCDFSFDSITFVYYTTDSPEKNQFDEYSKIIRRSTQIKKREFDMGKDTLSYTHDIDVNDEGHTTIAYKYNGTDESYFVISGRTPGDLLEEHQYAFIEAGNPIDRKSMNQDQYAQWLSANGITSLVELHQELFYPE